MKRYPPVILATCVIPWTESYEVHEDLFAQQVRLLQTNLTPHLYIFGTAGEGYAVSDSMFNRIARLFRSLTSDAPDHPMVGVISLSLATIIERIGFCHDLGFRDFQISLPSWGSLNEIELKTFFDETCGRFQDCRFLHYNLQRTKRVLTAEDYARLAVEYPNLVAVKFGGGDEAMRAAMLKRAPNLQFFFTEPGFCQMRDRAECGLLISHALTNFDAARQLFTARGPQLAEMSKELGAVGDALHAAAGESAHMDGAFDKLIIKAHLRDFPLRLLPPYASIGDDRVHEFLNRLPPRWKPDIPNTRDVK
jgi:hypothetical protein